MQTRSSLLFFAAVVLCSSLFAQTQESAIPFPACAKALDDTAGPGCIKASSRSSLDFL